MCHQEHSGFRGGILADEMGLGKTLQTIAVMLANESDPLPQYRLKPDLLAALSRGEKLPPGAERQIPRGFSPYVSEGVHRERMLRAKEEEKLRKKKAREEARAQKAAAKAAKAAAKRAAKKGGTGKKSPSPGTKRKRSASPKQSPKPRLSQTSAADLDEDAPILLSPSAASGSASSSASAGPGSGPARASKPSAGSTSQAMSADAQLDAIEAASGVMGVGHSASAAVGATAGSGMEGFEDLQAEA